MLMSLTSFACFNSQLAGLLALVAQDAASTSTPTPKNISKQVHGTPCEALGLALGWSDAMQRLAGVSTAYQYYTISQGASNGCASGVLFLSWTINSIRVEKLEQSFSDATLNIQQDVEEYFPLRGEYVSAQVRPGWTDNAIVTCMRSPPTLTMTLLGVMPPALRNVELIVPTLLERQTAVHIHSVGGSTAIDLHLNSLERPIPAIWHIRTQQLDERVALLDPVLESATGRTIPALVIRCAYEHDKLVETSAWVLLKTETPDGVPMKLPPGMIVSDLRGGPAEGITQTDRELELDAICAWLAAPFGPLGNAQPSQIKSYEKVLDRQMLVEQSNAPDPLREGLKSAPATQLEFPPEVAEAIRRLGLRQSVKAQPPGRIIRLPGLPFVNGASRSAYSLPIVDRTNTTHPESSGAAQEERVGNTPIHSRSKSDARECGRIIIGPAFSPEQIRLCQVDADLRAVGKLTVQETSDKMGPRSVIEMANMFGLEVTSGLPFALTSEAQTMELGLNLSRPWARSERPYVVCKLSDQSQVILAVDIDVAYPPIRFQPSKVELLEEAPVDLTAYSEAFDILSWKWFGVPECVTIGEERLTAGACSWSIRSTNAADRRHKCASLKAKVRLSARESKGNSGSEIAVMVNVLVVHPQTLRDEEHRDILGGVFLPGELVVVLANAKGELRLWCPDRVMRSLVKGSRSEPMQLFATRVPELEDGKLFDWVPSPAIKCRVLGYIHRSVGANVESWNQGASEF